MTTPQIKLALDRQKSRTFKIMDLIKEPKYRAWNSITVRMQARILGGLWPRIRYGW